MAVVGASGGGFGLGAGGLGGGGFGDLAGAAGRAGRRQYGSSAGFGGALPQYGSYGGSSGAVRGFPQYGSYCGFSSTTSSSVSHAGRSDGPDEPSSQSSWSSTRPRPGRSRGTGNSPVSSNRRTV